MCTKSKEVIQAVCLYTKSREVIQAVYLCTKSREVIQAVYIYYKLVILNHSHKIIHIKSKQGNSSYIYTKLIKVIQAIYIYTRLKEVIPTKERLTFTDLTEE
jgi:hypothetical protein